MIRKPRPTQREPLGRARFLRVGLGFGVFLLAFAAAALLFDPAALAQQLGRLSAGLVVALLALSLLNYLLRFVRWRLFALPMAARAPLAVDLVTYMASFSLTATPGKAGELLRIWLLKRRAGLPYGRTLPVFLADRLCDFLALALLSLGSLGWVVGSAGALLLALGAAALVLLLFLVPRPLVALVGWLYGRVGRWPRGFAQVRRTLRQGVRLRRPGLWVAGIALGLLGWGCEAASLWLVLQALGSPVALADAAAVFALSLIVGVVSLLPGGLGGTEAGMVGLLLLRGVPTATALAATLAVRLATLWFAVALGLAFLPFALRGKRSG